MTRKVKWYQVLGGVNHHLNENEKVRMADGRGSRHDDARENTEPFLHSISS